jgi:PAS domain S-box-containing protein
MALEPAILGRILLLQSTLSVAPNERRLLEMVASGMMALPGVVGSIVCLEGLTATVLNSVGGPVLSDCRVEFSPDSSDNSRVSLTTCADECPFRETADELWTRIDLRTPRQDYGAIFLKVQDQARFTPYLPFASNTANLVALHIENERIAAELITLNRGLDQLVQERTQQLQESELRFRNLVEGSLQGICVHRDNAPLFLNEAWASVRGFSIEEAYKLDSIVPYVAEHERDRLSIYQKARLAGESAPSHYEFEGIKKDGSIVRIETIVSVVDWGGEPAILSAIIDVSARKHADQENRTLQDRLRHSQKMEAVGQLAAGVAHEFNNLLVGILSNAESLLSLVNNDTPEVFEGTLKDIEKAGTQAAELTKQLLSFSRQEAPSLSQFDVNQLVTRSQETFKRFLGANITLKVQLANCAMFVHADESYIERAVTNLTINSRDAMPNGGTITIQTDSISLTANEVAPEHKPGSYMRLTVTDDGCGMSPEVAQRIFEPFFTTKPLGKGTGLGLSTVFADVNKIGGFVTCKSNVGKGTAICIHLPLTEEATGLTDAEDEPTNDFVGGNETILVCDDEELVLDSISLLLETVGYTVIKACGPSEAIEAAKNHHGSISLLLTDLTMPVLNGLKLAKEIERLHPDIITIVMSGYAEDDHKTEDAEYKQFKFIQKPTPFNLLSRILRTALDNIGK